MRSFHALTVGLVAATIALAACQPPRDVRPPYHEPVAAKPAPTVSTPAAAEPPVGRLQT